MAAYGANIKAAVKAAEANGEVSEVQLRVSDDYRRNAGLIVRGSAVMAGVRLAEILKTLR